MTGRFANPPHAHIPGGNDRPVEAVFAPFRIKSGSVETPAALAASDCFRAGLQWLEDGYYWESHELLEMVWGNCPPNSAEKRQVQALIQLANAGLKQKMDRPAAVTRILALAREAWTEAERRGACLLTREETARFHALMLKLGQKNEENAL